MHRIDTPTALADANGTGKDGFAAGTLPGTPPTKASAAHFNDVQEEICSVIEDADITLVKGTQDQLLKAITKKRVNAIGPLACRNWVGVSVPTPEDSTFKDIVWSEEDQQFVAVASAGTNRAYWSLDGVIWHIASVSVAANEWNSVAYSPSLGRYVAVAGTGTNRVAYSADGDTWTAASASQANTWQSVCWAAELNLFVAVSADGTNRVMTSPDGITWTNRTAAAANSWNDICYSPELNLFVACALNGTDRIMTSPDGTTWTSRNVATVRPMSSVCWSPELARFCALGYSGGASLSFTSSDGITWTAYDINDADFWWIKVRYAPETQMFCAVAYNDGASTNYAVVAYSKDGQVWKHAVTPSIDGLYSLAWSPTLMMWVAVGSDVPGTMHST